MLILEKSEYLYKFHFPVKLYEIRKNVIIKNYLLQKDLQI